VGDDWESNFVPISAMSNTKYPLCKSPSSFKLLIGTISPMCSSISEILMSGMAEKIVLIQGDFFAHIKKWVSLVTEQFNLLLWQGPICSFIQSSFNN
jgi:hypothetical protein